MSEIQGIRSMKKIRVVQVVPMLGPGGTERVVVDLALGLDRGRFEVKVLSIWRRVGSDLERILDDSGIPVEYLGKEMGFDGRAFHRLHRAVRDFQPDVV